MILSCRLFCPPDKSLTSLPPILSANLKERVPEAAYYLSKSSIFLIKFFLILVYFLQLPLLPLSKVFVIYLYNICLIRLKIFQYLILGLVAISVYSPTYFPASTKISCCSLCEMSQTLSHYITTWNAPSMSVKYDISATSGKHLFIICYELLHAVCNSQYSSLNAMGDAP